MQGEFFQDQTPVPSPPPQPTANRYEKQYQAAYAKLNAEQKKAVDLIEGPVLVNAGPGTGKTQILAIRIGKILKEQQIAPHNILCLTYTEAAAVEMRKRLIKFIGPTAHQVHINTYHGFCNQVIQENMEIFGHYRQLEAITDLERVDLLRELIDDLDDANPLKRYKYDRYLDVGRMKKLFELMKKENLSAAEINKKVEEHMEGLIEQEAFTAKAKTRTINPETGEVYGKGDFRQDKYDERLKKYDDLRLAAAEFENFNKLMKKNERYDFNDMILWVLKAFKENENLLSNYQERYQYFLVDEYQDTNGAQNALMESLISFWDQPNVFVVGDDDQAIFKFQGANLNNILDFNAKYKPEVVVLKQNYRSNQLILDRSKQLIENNTERLIDKMPGLDKELVAQGAYKTDKTKVTILSFDKRPAEIAFLAAEMEKAHKQNPDSLKETAIIFRWNRQVADLVTVLEKKGIPLSIRKRVNILTLPIVQNLIEILEYLSEEHQNYGSGQYRLFEILHYKYFKIDSLDLGKIALCCKKKYIEDETVKWREVIADESVLDTLKLKDKTAILEASSLLNNWVTQLGSATLQKTFEMILNEGGVLDEVMASPERAWRLQVISTFFDFIKTETAKNPSLTLKEFISILSRMEENFIEMPVQKTISSASGVNLLTAHSAKGLEFKKVYLLGCTKDIWDKSGSHQGQYSYPDNINVDSKTNEQDERRLFYVAMTRAEKELVLSYSHHSENDKSLSASRFVEEIRTLENNDEEITEVTEDVMAGFYYELLKRRDIVLPLIDQDLIEEWLHGYKLSVTHLNKFLRCPLTFYFESVLRVPGARNAASGFGSAMHDCLHKFIDKIKSPDHRDVSLLLFHFDQSLKNYKSHFTSDEFDSHLLYGKKVLKALHKEKTEEWLSIPDQGLEIPLTNAVYKSVPLKGVLDKVEIHPTYVRVVDYKTGTYKAEKIKRIGESKDPDFKGSDYWRQLVFYKMLLDSDGKYNWNMTSGVVDFIEPDRKKGTFKSVEMAITPEDLQAVGEQITDTYEKIKSHDFNTSCEDKECKWCNFVADNYPDEGAIGSSTQEVYDLN